MNAAMKEYKCPSVMHSLAIRAKIPSTRKTQPSISKKNFFQKHYTAAQRTIIFPHYILVPSLDRDIDTQVFYSMAYWVKLSYPLKMHSTKDIRKECKNAEK